MTLRAFIGIIVAVALGVHFGLKIHENPDYLSNLLSILWSLFKLLFLLGIIISVVGGVIYGIWWLFENGDTIELPSWLDTIIEILGILLVLAFIVTFIYSWWSGVQNKGGLKKWFQNKKDKRAAEKKKIANLKGEEKEKYEKRKKDRIIIIICLGIILSPGIILTILSLFGADI